MLGDALEKKEQEFAIEKQEVGVLISDEALPPLILQLPPTAELHEIRKLLFSKVSADEIYGQFDDTSKDYFRIERDQLLAKYDKYKESPTYQSHLATLTEFSGDLNGVVGFLQKGTAVDPSGFLIHRLARTFMALNNLPEADKTLRHSDLKRNTESNLGLACLAILQDDYGKALKFVNDALDIDEMNVNALMLAGILEIVRNNLDRAIRYLRSAKEERPDLATPYVLLGIAYYRLGRKDRAAATFKRAVAINPIDANVVILYADTLFSEKRYSEVVQVLETFVQYEQKSVAAWDRLGRALSELGDYANALTALRHQASILEDFGVWNNIALVYWKMGDKKRAMNYLSLAVEKSAESHFSTFLPLYNAFALLRASGHFEEAIALTEMIPRDRIGDLARTGVFSSIIALRCDLLAAVGRTEEAAIEIDRLLRAKDIHRDLRLSTLQSATFFYSLVQPDRYKALDCAHLALAELEIGGIDSEKKNLMLNNVVFVLLEFGELNEASKHIQKLSSSIHKSANATATLGLMHLRKGHFDEGKRLYEEAVSMTTDRNIKSRLKQKMHLELGRFFIEQGQTRAAIRYLKGAVNSDLNGIKNQAVDLLKALS